MKYIFLDVDGVIATPESIDESGFWCFTNSCQDELGHLIKKTGAKLVISSSWRKHDLETTIDHFNKNGFRFCEHIIGVTIRAYHYIEKGIHLSIPRGVEIKQWLDTNVHSDNGKNYVRKAIGKDFTYVILDDDPDMLLAQKDYFIRTNPETGLTNKETDQAIHILNSTK